MAAEGKRCCDKYPHLQRRIRVEEQLARKDNRFLRGGQIARLIDEITERGVVTKRKGQNSYTDRKKEETLVAFYTRMPRDTVRQCQKKWETQEDLAWSKHPLQYRK